MHFYGHVLVTSASRKAPLIVAVRQAARRLHPDTKVIAGDVNAQAVTRYVADEFWQMPPISDVSFAELLSGCRRLGIRFVIPTRDGELAFWARHREELAAQGIDVIVSDLCAVERCLDKLVFAQFGRERGLPFIPTALDAGTLGCDRYVVKERLGAGSRGVGLNLDYAAAIAHARTLQHPVFQPYLAGAEVSIDAWIDRNHVVKAMVLRHRDVVEHGESQLTTTFRDANVESQAGRALAALQLRGPAVMQVFAGGRGEIGIIEVNARFGGASTAGIAAGMDPWYWSLLEACGADVSDYPFSRIAGELRQVRVPSDIYVHAPDL